MIKKIRAKENQERMKIERVISILIILMKDSQKWVEIHFSVLKREKENLDLDLKD